MLCKKVGRTRTGCDHTLASYVVSAYESEIGKELGTCIVKCSDVSLVGCGGDIDTVISIYVFPVYTYMYICTSSMIE